MRIDLKFIIKIVVDIGKNLKITIVKTKQFTMLRNTG